MTEDSIRKELSNLSLKVHDNGTTSKNIEKMLEGFQAQIDKACDAISIEKDERKDADDGIKTHFNSRFTNTYIALTGFLSTTLIGLIIYIATGKN